MFRAVALVDLVVLSFGLPLLAGKKERKPIPELAEANSIFVAGNSQAADQPREVLRERRTCFTLTGKREDADAALEIGDGATADAGVLRTRTSIVSRTVTLHSGKMVWSNSRRFSDAPFISGSKTAAKLLPGDLVSAADCKGREGKK
jgi:hypothetical protein